MLATLEQIFFCGSGVGVRGGGVGVRGSMQLFVVNMSARISYVLCGALGYQGQIVLFRA